MIRSRIFRLKSFWLGLPGLLLLVWAWADSMSYKSGVLVTQSLRTAARSPGSVDQFAGQSGGAFRVTWWLFDDAATSQVVYEGIRPTRETGPTREYFPAPGLKTRRMRGYNEEPGQFMGARMLTVPHWLLTLAYLAVWGGLMAQHWKAARKMEAGPEEEDASLGGEEARAPEEAEAPEPGEGGVPGSAEPPALPSRS